MLDTLNGRIIQWRIQGQGGGRLLLYRMVNIFSDNICHAPWSYLVSSLV